MPTTSTRPFIRALLVDVSGNLHVGSNPTPHAVQAFDRLRSSNVPFRLCSNTSKESTATLISRLKLMGFEIAPDEEGKRKEVWTSIGAVKQFIKNMGLHRCDSCVIALSKILIYHYSPYLLLSDSAREEVLSGSDITDHTESEYDSVVIGLAPSAFDYSHLNAAFRILVGETQGATSPSSLKSGFDLPLIATHKAKYIQTQFPPGLSLGPGPFVTALENASGRKAFVVGKPTKAFFEAVISNFLPSELPEDRGGKIAIIGDDVEADLGGGAIELGLWRILGT
jgi:HAD superfamily hydrolase (TIGR01450 family)